jgi:hypothetical protein
VHGLEGERAQDEHFERALQDVGAIGIHGCSFCLSEGEA